MIHPLFFHPFLVFLLFSPLSNDKQKDSSNYDNQCVVKPCLDSFQILCIHTKKLAVLLQRNQSFWTNYSCFFRSDTGNSSTNTPTWQNRNQLDDSTIKAVTTLNHHRIIQCQLRITCHAKTYAVLCPLNDAVRISTPHPNRANRTIKSRNQHS